MLDDDRSAWWVMLGRNKRSTTINLKSDRGREAFLRLTDAADALVEAYRPGVLEHLGLAPDLLLERNDRLVVVRISGFGQSGPRSSQPGLGTLAEAYSGFASITGEADGPPMLPPVALADESAALFATWALLAALYRRYVRGGSGQTIDISLYESLYHLLGPLPTLARHLGHAPVRSGSRLSFSSPRNVYRTSDSQWIAVSGSAPSRMKRLLELSVAWRWSTTPCSARRVTGRRTPTTWMSSWPAGCAGARPPKPRPSSPQGRGRVSGVHGR